MPKRSCCARATAPTKRSPLKSSACPRSCGASGATDIRTVARRRRAAQILVGAQSGLSRRGPHPARLLLHGRHHPEEAAGRSAGRHRATARSEFALAVPERVPCRRRQPASADHVRRERRRPAAARRGLRRRASWSCASKSGGTITGEHGVGIEKINQMCVQFRPAELTAFHAIKHAFDEHRAAQSRQGRADAAPLRRVRRDARAARAGEVSRAAAVLLTMHTSTQQPTQRRRGTQRTHRRPRGESLGGRLCGRSRSHAQIAADHQNLPPELSNGHFRFFSAIPLRPLRLCVEPYEL